MTYDEIEELKILKVKKNIKNRDIARHIGKSDSYITLFFKHKLPNMDVHVFDKIKQYILKQPEYRTIRVIVDPFKTLGGK